MSKKEALQLFGDKTIRTAWSEKEEKWYFSIIDVVAVLTDSAEASAYWRKLKERLLKEGNETVTNCHTFKMRAADGKMRQTDVADQEQLFRLIQSIPSPKAEPFKQWMAQVASEVEVLPLLPVENLKSNYGKASSPAKTPRCYTIQRI